MEGALAQASTWLLQSIGTLCLLSLLKYVLIAATTYAVYMVVFKPSISPLRKIPGLPYRFIWGNISDITTGEDRSVCMEKLVKLRAKYGPVFRIYLLLGTERLMITDPDLMKHVMVTNSRNYKKPSSLFRIIREVLGDGLVTLNGAEHATHRRLISPSFNNASIKSMIPVFEEGGKKLANKWISCIQESQGKSVVPIQNELSSTALDVIGKTAFGYDFNSLENPHDPLNKAFQEFLEGKNISSGMQQIPGYLKLPIPKVLALKRVIKVMHEKVLSIIALKKQELSDDASKVTKDILGKMVMAKDEASGTGLTEEELKCETMTLMGAGHETTSTAMAWFLLHLAKDPKVQRKCQDEIREHFESTAEITWELLEKLEYLECAIKETLRLTPPVPLVIRESIEADRYHEHYIPKGSFVICGLAPMMRSPDIFEDPDSFKPERFMISDEANKNMYKFLPFVIGPRMCLGYKFAMVEMKVILACLLQKLNFEMVPGRTYEPSTANRITMRPKPALELFASELP